MLNLFTRKPSEGAALLRQALGPQVMVVLSASCCMPGTGDMDARLEANARAALAAARLDWPVLKLTVTQAQGALAEVLGGLDAGQAALAREVSQLFVTRGLNAFPALIVNQRLVSYGGVADTQLIAGALRTGHGKQSA